MTNQEHRKTQVVQFDNKVHEFRYGGQYLYKYWFDNCPMCKQFKMKRTEYPDGTGYEVCYTCDYMKRW